MTADLQNPSLFKVAQIQGKTMDLATLTLNILWIINKRKEHTVAPKLLENFQSFRRATENKFN